MLLVLGRPGSGCITLLKLLANRRLCPYTYASGALLTFNIFSAPVYCRDSEYAVFNPPASQTCTEYLRPYLETGGSG
ncbi:ABC transporter G family member 9 [Aspergillus udagawae]|uniref:ABC transporter G family member 9 n=1 Tax=Aspergillus udagawae TaxID=91492 RepID=A0A8H3SCJ8_9EURO|nr:ABC transporter G family member 9 [Aspergillus udagawae]